MPMSINQPRERHRGARRQRPHWHIYLLVFVVLSLTTMLLVNASALSPQIVTISKTAPDSAVPGGQITYVITVQNWTDDDLTGVAVYDKVPGATAFIYADNGGTVVEGDYVYWETLPDIPPGEALAVSFSVQAPETNGVTVVNDDYGVYFGAFDLVIGEIPVLTEVGSQLDPTPTATAPGPTPTSTPTPPSGQFVVDTGFRPSLNGYRFENYGQSQFEASDLDAGALIGLFGAQNVCQTGATPEDCVLTAAARAWREQEIQGTRIGHCAGLAMNSMRFFAGYDNFRTFEPDAGAVYDLALNPTISNHITQWHMVQGLEPADGSGAGWLFNYGEKTPNEALDIARQHMQNSPNDLLYMGIRGQQGGHAVNPYAIADKGGGIFWMYVYDNNEPNKDRYVIFDTNANTWRYAFGALNPSEPVAGWEGNAQTKTIRMRPTTALNKGLWACPFCGGQVQTAGGPQVVDNISLQLLGEGKMLIINQEGRKIGWDFENDRYVNEISGSQVDQIDGGLGKDEPPIYTLPQPNTNAPYTVYVSGDTLDNPVDADLIMTGPGFAVGLEYIAVSPGEDLLMTLRPDGRQITFNASEEGTYGPDIYFALDPDPDGDSYIFTIAGFVLSSFKTVTVTLDIQQGQLYFEDDDGGSDTYALAVLRIKNDGTEQYYANDGVVLGGDADAAMNFGAWDGQGTMSFTIDGQVTDLGNEERTLTIGVVGQGWVATDAEPPYLPGEQLQLLAVPEPGWAFAGWSGGASGNANPLTITMSSDKQITATFRQTGGGQHKTFAPLILRR